MQVKPRRQTPETRTVAVAPIYNKFSSYPSNGLTPQRLAAIFREADEGEVYRQMELFEEMEEKDPHLYAQLQTRKNAVTGLDWEIVPFSDEPRDKEIAAFVTGQLHGIRNLEDAFLDMLDAIGKGLSASEIIWKYDGGEAAVERIDHLPPKLLRWDMDDILRIVTKDEPLGIVPPPNKFIFHYYRAKSGHPSRAGILRVCAWMYLFKNYDVKDWVSFIEVFGLPLRLGKYSPGASEDEKNALWEALVKMGTDAAGMVPDGCTIDFVTSDGSKGAANGIYETLARYCDEQISKAILGQTLTADSGGGSFAQSKTHNDVRHDLTVADCKALGATLRDDLIRPLVLFNFGADAAVRLPLLVFDCAESDDLQALSGILNTLVGFGTPVPLSYIYQKFSIPEPQNGEAVARLPAPITPPHPLAMVANKAPPLPENADRQKSLDRLADAATAQGIPLFEQVAAPLRAMLEHGGTLEDIRGALDDPDKLQAVFNGCVSDELTTLLANSMLLADLTGRAREDGR